MALWRDRRGRVSPLRILTLVGLCLPALYILYQALTVQLGPRPINEAIHQSGLWMIRFLLITLAVSPVRRIARFPQLFDVRRMLGVGTFCYGALHFTLYLADISFDMAKAVTEIVFRIYLTIGFLALSGLAALAATSNDYMVRRLGGLRWRRLHMLVYPIAILGCIHFVLQSKAEVFEPTWMAGLFGWMLLYRALHWTRPRRDEFPLWTIAALGVAAAALTFIFEAIAFWLAYGASPVAVLVTDFTFAAGIRPGWYVLAFTMALTFVGTARSPNVRAWIRARTAQPEVSAPRD